MKLDNPRVKTARNGIKYVPARLIESSWRWYIEYQIYDEVKDKLVRKRFTDIKGSTESEKRADAKKHIQNINKALKEGIYKKDRDHSPKDLSIKKGIEYVIETKERELSKRSSANYRLMLQVFLEYLGNKRMLHKPVRSIKKEDIVIFLDNLMEERGISPATRNNYRRYVGSAFIAMQDRGFVEENPVAGIKKLRTTQKEYRAFSREDYQKIEQYLLTNDIQLYRFTKFIYYGFIRPVEITRIRIKDIDLANRVILISPEDQKNRKQLPVEITKSLREIIEDMNLEGYDPDDYVFSRSWQPGKVYLWRNRASEKHKKVLQKLGLDNGIYDLYSHKHTGNQAAFIAGMNIYWLMRQNRHSSIKETEPYLRRLGLIRKEAQEKDW
ncbi:MAG: site-specific integrase [Bacteroidota bacterium]